MTDIKPDLDATQHLERYEEPELYVVPATMTGRDQVGVIVALVALAIIGFVGYVWLNPDLDLEGVLSINRHPATIETPAPSTATNTPVPKPGASTAASFEAAQAEKEPECAVCGMFAAKSRSHIIVLWAGGGYKHFDSWDCVFNYEKDNKQILDQAQVIDFNSPENTPAWLDATSAYYIFGANEVAGSMPPYIAAFATKGDAEAAQKTLGGAVVPFGDLRKKWSAQASSKQT